MPRPCSRAAATTSSASASALRAAAETLLADRTAEADAAAQTVRAEADAYAEQVRGDADTYVAEHQKAQEDAVKPVGDVKEPGQGIAALSHGGVVDQAESNHRVLGDEHGLEDSE